ncbi:hypothetical protein, partial [Leifsonia shinshuensis]|uniref:hypothetical protein n=1 Tax=Leifsonia shinshuensis TaxID=150026 RepID=UPI0035E63108
SGYYYINNSPVAEFSYSPSPAYEGDTISLLNESYDPDGHSMTAEWRITDPDGNTTIQNNWDGSINSAIEGDYIVRLNVEDEIGFDDQKTKIIEVNHLGIEGSVDHTNNWRQNHERLGNEPGQFYSGEAFIINAKTNAAREVDKVEVNLESERIDGREYNELITLNQLSVDQFETRYQDETLINPDTKLKDGPMHFTFTAYYRNGHISEDVVEIEIIGGVYDLIRIRRMN